MLIYYFSRRQAATQTTIVLEAMIVWAIYGSQNPYKARVFPMQTQRLSYELWWDAHFGECPLMPARLWDLLSGILNLILVNRPSLITCLRDFAEKWWPQDPSVLTALWVSRGVKPSRFCIYHLPGFTACSV